MKIPPEWFHLYAGDRIHTTLPFHRIQAGFESMRKQGYRLDAEPSARGYWVVCTRSPLVPPYKRETAA